MVRPGVETSKLTSPSLYLLENTEIVQAAVAPVFGWVLLRWSDVLGVPRAGWRRGLATLVAAIFSLWLCLPALLPVAHLRAMPSQPLEIVGTEGIRLDPIASQRMDIRSLEAVVAVLAVEVGEDRQPGLRRQQQRKAAPDTRQCGRRRREHGRRAKDSSER